MKKRLMYVAILCICVNISALCGCLNNSPELAPQVIDKSVETHLENNLLYGPDRWNTTEVKTENGFKITSTPVWDDAGHKAIFEANKRKLNEN